MKQQLQNKFNLNVLCIFLFLPSGIQFVNVLVNNMGIGASSTVTMSIYLCVFLYMFFGALKRGIFLKKDIKFLFILFIFLGLNYILFDSIRDYIFSQEMLIVLGIYIPCCVISIRKIKDFTLFADVMKPYAVVTALISGILLLFFNYENLLNYMEFSYALLPMGCALFWLFVKRNDKIAGISSLAILIEIISFGARAPILFFFLFCILTLVFIQNVPKRKKHLLIAVGVILIIFIYVGFDSILSRFSELGVFSDSRFITKIMSGDLFTSEGRNMVYAVCKERLSSMGLYIGGFFGDRPYCKGMVYPHSIIYEILMSWGWIIGSCILIWLLYRIIKAFIIKPSERLMCCFVILTLLGRFFVSGSYLIEGKFWIFLTVILVLSRRNSQLESEIGFETEYCR